jgi:hypothetical protein
MIPEFQDNGYLPPGIHPATLDEIELRFGKDSELRRVQAESLRWLVDLAARAGIVRIVIDGSFITDALEPNDVDCVLLIGSDFPADASAAKELQDGLPFLDIELVEAPEFALLVDQIFGTDRDGVPKGLIEVIP